jgi:hypothetical protein
MAERSKPTAHENAHAITTRQAATGCSHKFKSSSAPVDPAHHDALHHHRRIRMTTEQMMKFADQELADQLAWFRANNPKVNERELGIYAAAFSAGYRKALAAVVFHGKPTK